MISDQERFRYLLNAYVDSSCSREEMEELFGHIREAQHSEELNAFLLETWNDIQPGKPVPSIADEDMFRQVVRLPAVSRVRFNGMRAAAVFFIAVLGAALAYYVFSPSVVPASAPIANKELPKTPPAHKLITLPDGSTVLLNNHSTLDFPQTFASGIREVTLHGEAYFDIVKDPSRPFIIHSGKLQTRVLGTAFNIRAYADEEAVVVTVTRGKVKVELEDKTLGIIAPNQQISFNTVTSKAVHALVVADSVITWKEKDLVFDNITFTEAAETITLRYGVSIQFANAQLKNCRFTASFLNENPVEQILKVICDLNKASYTLNNNKVMISGEGCK